jgi:ABC-type multidrug transport system fused ATPase/permease subunit
VTATLRVLTPFIAPEWRALALGVLSTFAAAVAWVALPLPVALVVDRLLGEAEAPFGVDSGDWRFVGLVAGLVLAIALVAALGRRVAADRLAEAGERVTLRLRTAALAQLQRMSLDLPEGGLSAARAARLSGDVNAVGGVFPGAFGSLLSAVTLLAGTLAVSLIVDPMLGLTALVALAAMSYLSFRAGRRGTAGVIGGVALAVVLGVGVLRVAAGALTPGELVIVWAYAFGIEGTLRAISRDGRRLVRDVARAERVAEVLAADDVLEQRRDTYSGPRAAGDLELEDVPLSHDPGGPGSAGLTMRILAGDRLALLDSSGAGRSALPGLIARFHDPPPGRGRVSLDGRDLRDCSLRWLREQVGLLLRDSVLLPGTVAENIAYGLEAGRDEVIAAAEAAGAHAFVAELPQGYETRVGQGGMRLPDGQRQRVAFARALLRDPPVLILDEPSTGLDGESEARAIERLAALMRGRTTVIVTRSARLAATADRVVLVEGGRVTREGPPALVLPEEPRVRVRPAWRAERAPVPADRGLPQMAQVLDTDVMAEVLARSLGEDADPPHVRVRDLRYRPETDLLVHYDVGIEGSRHRATATISRGDLERRARRSENQALADMVQGRSPAEHPLSFEPGLGALVQWLPLDLSLWALALPPAQRDRRLRNAGVPTPGRAAEPLLLGYRPHSRAVVRLNGHVLRYYASHASFGAALAGLEAAERASVRAPGFAGSVPELLVTVQSHASGPGLDSPAAVAVDAGAALARLHAGGPSRVRDFPPAEQLRAAAASATLVARVVPSLRTRLGALLGRLEATAPVGLGHVPAHGEFDVRRLLDGGDGLLITDFDAMCSAPAALDVASYVTHLVRGGAKDLHAALAALDLVLQGYGERPAGLSWYLATTILHRSPEPFRHQDEHWPKRVEEMVTAAERAYA